MTIRLIRPVLAIALVMSISSSAIARDADIVDSPVGDKWALVIGVSQFKNPNIPLLKFAAKDASDFADYLVREANFAPDHVKVLTNEQATQKHIMSELGSKWLPRVAMPDDLVVIFISTHGSPAEMDLQGVNYIVAHDSEPDDLYTTAIEMQDLVSTVSRRVHAKRLVFFLDSCHSGAANAGAKGIKRATNIDLAKVPLGTGQIVISSSQSDQVSWELKDRPNGAFTYCLLDVLRKQRDEAVPQVFTSLQDRVQQTVLRERGVLQTPVLKSTWKGRPVSLAVAAANPHAGLDAGDGALLASGTVPAPPLVAIATGDQKIPATQPAVDGRAATPSAPRVTATALPTHPGPITSPISTQPATQVVPVEGSVQKSGLPDSIAILPFAQPSRVNIQQLPPNMKVLWGVLRNPAELVNLPNRLSEGVFRELRNKFSSRVLGPRSVADGLEEGHLSQSTSSWSTAEWERAGRALQAKYLVTATIDEVSWSTSMMANKYTLIVSAKLMSGETGQVLAELNSFKVHKAPFQGDTGGAAKYFENTVAQDAAEEIAKKFWSALRR
jgi:hypothetical protein